MKYELPMLHVLSDCILSPGLGFRSFAGARSLFLTVVVLMPSLASRADEDILRLLTWEGYAPEKVVQDFEKRMAAKYGRKVTLEVSFVDGSEDFYGPVRTRSADVITISHHLFKDPRFNYIGNQLLLPINLSNILNHDNVVEDLKKADYHCSHGNVYGVPVAQGPYGLAFNTHKMTSAPTSWQVFWDPGFKGQYVLGAHEYLYNVNIVALVLGYPRDVINSYDALNNELFKAKLRELTVNAHSFWVGQDKADDLQGRTLAASWGDSFASLRARGEAWKMAAPKEGTPWWIDDYAITWTLRDKPFLKRVAEEWINEVLEPDFQVRNIIRDLSIYPTVTHIHDKLTPDEKQRFGPGRVGSVMEGRIFQQTVSRRDRNGLRLLWSEAMEGMDVEKTGDQ
ncbi:MAG: extracellular solute-binding protein [bacterium]|nr:extracellular solute-binding protein [bacterium]